MKIYTKSGDKGETSLFGGQRVLKNCNRINAYGTVDELNSFLGAALSEIKTTELKEVLLSIQNNLFTLGGDLATPIDQTNKNVVIQRINEKNIFELEHLIDKYDEKLPELRNFILPGGTKGAALLHVARSVCRRAEREVVTLSKIEVIDNNIVVYLNRLSDLLFVLSRFENYSQNIDDIIWQK